MGGRINFKGADPLGRTIADAWKEISYKPLIFDFPPYKLKEIFPPYEESLPEGGKTVLGHVSGDGGKRRRADTQMLLVLSHPRRTKCGT